jgi:tricorn protease
LRTWIPAALLLLSSLCAAQPAPGYPRFPTVHGDTVVFTAEGDLWRTTTAGGTATRLTSRAGDAVRAAISPDGKSIAYSAAYDGPSEVYVMPLAGGVPRRLTWGGEGALVRGWTPGGEILVTTARASTLREPQLAIVSPQTSALRMVPLADARDGVLVDAGHLVFTRYGLTSDNFRGYRGGLTATLWRYALRGDAEAQPLTKAADGNAHDPMAWRDRVVFLSDRDGVTNLWSMDARGGDLRQLTRHRDFEVRSAAISGDRVVYQQGSSLHVLDLADGADKPLSIALASDFDQMRERWVRRPMEQFTALDIAAHGERVALTAHGHVALAGIGSLRRIDVFQPPASRLRNAVFMPDGKNVLAISDASGENELWLLPADGSGPGRQLTQGADMIRWQAVPSPDGRWIAHDDKDGRLWLLDVASGKSELLERHAAAGWEHEAYSHLAWSPDSQALAVEETTDDPESFRHQVVLYRVADRSRHVVTSARYSSGSPAFAPDGRWLWFISSRDFLPLEGSPWGDRNMGPYFDRREGVYAVALQPGNRFPFRPVDELDAARAEAAAASAAASLASAASAAASRPAALAAAARAKSALPAIVWDGLAQRLQQVPLPAGNYVDLGVDAKRLWLLEAETSPEHKTALKTLALENTGVALELFLPDVREFALSADRRKVAVRRWAQNGAGDVFLVDAEPKPPADLGKFATRVDDWQFAVQPADEWRQLFKDAWRLHRDWFYDPRLHGVDWLAIRTRYEALLPRVTDRAELEDLTGQMVAELSLMHSQVRRGEIRRPEVDIRSGVLGADFERVANGARVARIWRGDPERVFSLGPLARAEVGVAEGDVITAVNGRSVADVPDIAVLLRDKAGKQVLLDLLDAKGAKRRAVVVPAPAAEAHRLRDVDWQWERRRRVTAASDGKFGYLHLDAMGAADLSEFVREFYAVSNLEGLVIDVRDNDGGNIDSILIDKLMRRAWAVWQTRDGSRAPNMPDAFRGNLVVITNQGTYSDGETFAEGIKRLKLGTVVGMRTAGAGVWLDNDNVLADGGIARAAQNAQVGLDGTRLIEGVGVVPDIEVDNLPHATFDGQDAQLDMAIKVLKDRRAAAPRAAIPPFAYPSVAR